MGSACSWQVFEAPVLMNAVCLSLIVVLRRGFHSRFDVGLEEILPGSAFELIGFKYFRGKGRFLQLSYNFARFPVDFRSDKEILELCF